MARRRPTRGQRKRRRSKPDRAPDELEPLYRRCRSLFKPEEKQLGEELLSENRVTLEIQGTVARARVAATEEDAIHNVGINWTKAMERRIHVFCDCQLFSSGAFCGHIWASLLKLDLAASEQLPPGKDRLGLRKDRAASWRTFLEPAADHEPSSGSIPQEPNPAARKLKRRRTKRTTRRQGPTTSTSWRSQIAALSEEITSTPADPAKATSSKAAVQFAINAPESLTASGVVLDIFTRPVGAREMKRGKLERTSLEHRELARFLFPPDSEESPDRGPSSTLPLVAVLPDATSRRRPRGPRAALPTVGARRLLLPRGLYEPVLQHLCTQLKLCWWDGKSPSSLRALRWDRSAAWRLGLHLRQDSAKLARLTGTLKRDGENVPLSAPALILVPEGESDETSALVVFKDTIGRLQLDGHSELPWIRLLRANEGLMIPLDEVGQAVNRILTLPAIPQLEVSVELELSETAPPPRPRIAFDSVPQAAIMVGGEVIKRTSRTSSTRAVAPRPKKEIDVSRGAPPITVSAAQSPTPSRKTRSVARLSFDYGELRIAAQDTRTSIINRQERTLVQRDLDSEKDAVVRLLELCMLPVESADGDVQGFEIDSRELPSVIEPLLREGWAVEVEGRTVRTPSAPSLRIESGIDWFDLSGQVSFADDQLDLSEILESIARGDRFIELEDGSRGILPKDWMETYGSLSQAARESTGKGLRFLFSQALIVEDLLAEMPPVDVDATFTKLQQKLSSFSRIRPRKGPRTFNGTLRAYQQHGLGWLNFLREFGLGGVLADDMGLGKTVQVLALLLTHRTPSKTTHLPYLIVAPRSVVHNWLEEASTFTPTLRITEYHGAGREALRKRFNDFDIIVTTYGTLRQDAAVLAEIDFDTVILDEAQAIKNPASQTAKASRLLRAHHRLVLTGTPIENHLGDLGSLIEFLNPGILGKLPRLEVLTAGRAPQESELAQLAQDLRPFILRRTKAQVLPDLPPKTEQNLICDMLPDQRVLYDDLRISYQEGLLARVEKHGIKSSAIQVLEAILRLRQVACHPGLVDESWDDAGSAKLGTLVEQISEVLQGGHKLLIFSQFTKLLGYVRQHLDELQMPYAYLDGKTRKRGEVVERFQTDPDCNLFLMSLKAGGVGLNLTAAGYVFLLDPWWNPAVEAQAIDRTHRIGQTQPVFAYRLIARDTVEEKLLELQRSKRELAGALLEGKGQSLRDLTADDLRLLLS